MVVFSVAHADNVMAGQLELGERRLQARRLVDAGRKHHHGALVEDDIKFQSKIADNLKNSRLMRLPSGDDRTAN